MYSPYHKHYSGDWWSQTNALYLCITTGLAFQRIQIFIHNRYLKSLLLID